MSPEQMRDKLRSLYPRSANWYERVERMSDKQVYAIYNRALNEGNFKEKK